MHNRWYDVPGETCGGDLGGLHPRRVFGFIGNTNEISSAEAAFSEMSKTPGA